MGEVEEGRQRDQDFRGMGDPAHSWRRKKAHMVAAQGVGVSGVEAGEAGRGRGTGGLEGLSEVLGLSQG